MNTVGGFSIFLIGIVICAIIFGEIIHYYQKKSFEKKNPNYKSEYFVFRSESYITSFICIIIFIILFAFFYNMIVNFNVPLN